MNFANAVHLGLAVISVTTIWFRRATVAILLAMAIFGLGRGIFGAIHPLNARYWDGSNDFQWSTSRVLLSGTDPYALYLELGPANNAELGSPFILSQWADYPPSSLMILWPLAAMSWHAAKWSWLLINLASVVAIIASCRILFWKQTNDSCRKARGSTEGVGDRAMHNLLASVADAFYSMRESSVSRFIWFVVAFLACPSVSSTLKSGQHGLFSIAFFLLAVVVIDKGERETQPSRWSQLFAGVLLALSWLKYTMTLPLSLYFLTRGRRSSFAVAGALHITATLIAGLWTNTSPIELLRGNLEVASGNLGLVAFDLSQAVKFVGLEGYVLLASLLALGAWSVVWNSVKLERGEILSMLAFFSFVLLPHLRYDLFILVVPLAYACSQWRADRAMCVVFLLSIIQVWFVREIVESAIGQSPKDHRLAFVSHLVLASSIVLLYAPILLTWARLASTRFPEQPKSISSGAAMSEAEAEAIT